jgi:ATP-dependent helicase HrpA
VDELAALAARIPEAMLADQHRLRRRARAAEMLRRGGVHARARSFDHELTRLARDLERSIARRAARAASLPRPAFDLDLPILARREEIGRAIQQCQVCVICGETGSGKTTQLPKICLDLGRGVAGLIGHTQPRRIAARTVAARIAEELGAPLGSRAGPVGYKVRFGDHTGPDTYVKVMTDGILLAETQGDPWLEQYDTLIIDEAHERSLNIDFLLGYLKRLLPKRRELKVIITSATIDPDRFAHHFTSLPPHLLTSTPTASALVPAAAPIIEVSGRTYPVEVRYRPLASDDPDDRERDQESAILDAIDELHAIAPGDALVFLAGEREIRQTAEALRKHHPPGTEILPLFARLSAQEQMRVFQAHRSRRIVLATNVAETSLTVPGIKYVIDPGLARISRYNPRTKVQRLPIEPISQASADQRKGRCGRVQAGVCIRLYSEDDFKTRPRFTDPEILRTNLASVILQMKALRLGTVEEFPFVEPPDSRMIRDGYETLHELGALGEPAPGAALTRTGAQLAKLPIDPRLGRMILAAKGEGTLREVLIIAAALSIQDPRERPMSAQDAADQAHARFRDEHSDFVALLNLWNEYQKQAEHLSGSKLRKWCQTNFVSFVRMREWEDIHQQLHALVADMGFHENPATQPADYASIHRSLLTGLLSSIGQRTETFEYQGARGQKFHLFPGSGLFKRGPRWVMAAEIVQTTRLYARTVAKIEPEWVEALAGHLVKRSYSDAHWSKDAGQVMAFEKVSLFGLDVVPRRRVNYGPIDPAASRDLFIHALVEGDLQKRPAFLEHNLRLIDEVKRLEAKARKRDILADTRALSEFYGARLPPDVYSTDTLNRWLKSAGREGALALQMAKTDLLSREAAEVTPEKFPDTAPVAGTRLNLEYTLDPGGPTDGITMTVPLEALIALDERRTEWLVPGLLKDKILALLRSLPKQHRKALDPAPALAEQAAATLPFGRGDLYEALSTLVRERRGVTIAREAWQPRGIPDHFRLNIRVVDERGKVLGESRDVNDLKARFAARAKAAFERLAQSGPSQPDDQGADATSPFHRDGITDWEFGDLPESVTLDRGGFRLVAYPAILDRGETVSLRLLDSADAAATETRRGLRRLFILEARDELLYHVRLIPELPAMSLHYAPYGGGEQLKRDLIELAAERAFLSEQALGETSSESRFVSTGTATTTAAPVFIRTRAAFRARLESAWDRIGPAMREAGAIVSRVLDARHAVALRLAERTPPAWEPALADIREQLLYLLPKGFLGSAPYEQLRHLPRYLAAITRRMDKLENAGLARDARWAAEVAPHWRRCLDLARANPVAARSLAAVSYRWLIEEFRVSLFAQELGTAAPVSAKKLDEQWARIAVSG